MLYHRIFFVSCLLSKPLVSVFGIVCKNAFLNCVKKSSIVSLTSAYSNSCVKCALGFGLYFDITPWAPDELPVIVSPVTNKLFYVMYNFNASVSSASIVAVWPDVWPVTVSPFVNSPTLVCSLRI